MQHDHTCTATALPPEMYFDSWTNSYRDRFNDVWVSRPFGRKQWVASFRDRGNVSTIISRHHSVDKALEAAAQFIRAKCAWCGKREVRETLDGDPLCQSCCDKWARSEAA